MKKSIQRHALYEKVAEKEEGPNHRQYERAVQCNTLDMIQ